MKVSASFKRALETEMLRLKEQNRGPLARVEGLQRIVAELDSGLTAARAEIQRSGIDPDDAKLAVRSIDNASDALDSVGTYVKSTIHFLKKAYL